MTLCLEKCRRILWCQAKILSKIAFEELYIRSKGRTQLCRKNSHRDSEIRIYRGVILKVKTLISVTVDLSIKKRSRNTPARIEGGEHVLLRECQRSGFSVNHKTMAIPLDNCFIVQTVYKGHFWIINALLTTQRCIKIFLCTLLI